MSQFVIARINDGCQPLDRGEFYEDPLAEALEGSGLAEVTGGGSQLDENMQILYCELEIEVTGSMDEAKKLILDALTKAGAPKGSKLIFNDREEEFGDCERLALHFDNVNLPDKVYEKNDINDVIEKLEDLLGDAGKMTSHGRTEAATIVYFTGRSFAEMKQLISDFISEHPLLENSKVQKAV